MPKVNLEEGLSRFDDHWSPKIIADMNDYKVQLVKIHGEWIWHKHDDTDELFLVIAGQLRMEMRDGDVELGPGDLLVVLKGVEHRPVAPEEVHLLLTDYEFDPERYGDQARRKSLVPEQGIWLPEATQYFASFRGPSRDTCGTPRHNERYLRGLSLSQACKSATPRRYPVVRLVA